MKCNIHSHCQGDKAVPRHLQLEVAKAIDSVKVKPARGNVSKLRDEFLASLKRQGWSSEVAVSNDSEITITSMKDEIGLCLQTGNMARMYADLVKLQTLFMDNAIRAAAIVVPSQPIALLLGSNVAQSKRLERELEIFTKAYNVPTLVFALE